MVKSLYGWKNIIGISYLFWNMYIRMYINIGIIMEMIIICMLVSNVFFNVVLWFFVLCNS